jgi:hypothetical protein
VGEGFSKKCKIKSSPDSLINKKSSTSSVYPERTICSLFSLSCTKHAHHHLHNSECLKSHKELIKGVYVLLTKLEYIKDPLALKYLKKTDFKKKVKQNLLSSTKSQLKSNKINANLNSWRSVPRGNVSEQIAKDDFFSGNVPDMISDVNYNNGQLEIVTKVEDKVDHESETERSTSISPRPITRSRRRLLSRTSTESATIFFRRRRKRRINYIDDYSDSDTNGSASSISKQQKIHLQVRYFLFLRNIIAFVIFRLTY